MLVLIASTESFSTTLKHGEPKGTQRFSVIYGAWFAAGRETSGERVGRVCLEISINIKIRKAPCSPQTTRIYPAGLPTSRANTQVPRHLWRLGWLDYFENLYTTLKHGEPAYYLVPGCKA
jgi:hypothetical protein